MTQSKERMIYLEGNRPLKGGKVDLAGSSNQVTKAIMAAMLTDDPVTIKSAPQVDERKNVAEFFQYFGGKVEELDEHTLRLTSKDISSKRIPKEVSGKNRISILACGPLLHRFGEVSISKFLGGDQIGARPVDFHLQGFQRMGATLIEDDEYFLLKAPPKGLHGAHVVLPFPSVMTTENLLITASRARGRTIIENAAIEPEVIELAKMLQKMGADISIKANRTFVITGVDSMRGCEIRCMFDRNQAISFACAALATRGDVLLTNVNHDSVFNFVTFIQRMGAIFHMSSKGLKVEAGPKPYLPLHAEVEVHPGFMTDWQQPFTVLLTQAEGVSILHETVFENRLGYVDYLNQMGAQITASSSCLGESSCRFKGQNHIHSAIIQGRTPLVGRDFALPTDIRAGMCLVIAGLVATGTSKLSNVKELERKYDDLVPKLQAMGAAIEFIT